MYFRKSMYSHISIDGKEYELPGKVVKHFRDVLSVRKLKEIDGHKVAIKIVDTEFNDRKEYQSLLLKSLSKHKYPYILFLDPDNGLQPNNYNEKHILKNEVSELWDCLLPNSVMILYQHMQRRKNWVGLNRTAFAKCLNLRGEQVKVAKSDIAKDVVFYIAEKPNA